MLNYGYGGRILRVDLKARQVREEDLDPARPPITGFTQAGSPTPDVSKKTWTRNVIRSGRKTS